MRPLIAQPVASSTGPSVRCRSFSQASSIDGPETRRSAPAIAMGICQGVSFTKPTTIAASATNAAASGGPPTKTEAFDIGKFAGIFAAIGLALGYLGGALAAIIVGFVKLAPWQMPIAVLGAFLLISGPSVLLAWLKLRQRTLGPVLDATGWAINGRVKINVPLGAALTHQARLPANARRSLKDPYEDKAAARRRRRAIALLIFVALAAAGWWWRDLWWWRVTGGPPPAPAQATVTAPTAPAAPATKPAAKPANP